MRILGLVLAVLAAPAFAQVVDTRTARGMAFSTDASAIWFADEIGPQDRALLQEVVRLSATQLRRPLTYYASIAYSPDEGLASEALQSSANHHGILAADTAALAACNAARRSDAQPCRIAARIVPEGYRPQPLELSFGATTALQGEFRRMRGAKAFAISPSTGQFAFAGGAGAADMAVTQCNRSSQGANDCRIVVQD